MDSPSLFSTDGIRPAEASSSVIPWLRLTPHYIRLLTSFTKKLLFLNHLRFL
jgi:hypothetical protein